ncbi:DUF6162 family protein [Pseudodesulfovibrio sp. zrk46]|uniref:DUF6162 family protein n=1 Tax=Pseudodesulfovibrio sp. zrk46 TaxID=2725288 RepID=UPI001449A5AE|nr:DUF6162 family protein [Pseudodesulfovibrio sp. zrk46]QJB56952.1 hypothetical protein HFN16_11285 [Pseudodesulfovibrio sp. zrk46]
MGKNPRQMTREVVVKPSGSGTESRLVLMVALLTIAICSAAIVLRNTAAKAKEVPTWQVDAFEDLRAEELAIFNGLISAAPEIDIFHEDEGGEWPSVDALAADFIPPFVQDAAWKKNGAMAWIRSIINTQDKHIAMYVGHPLDVTKSGSFMLVMLHDHVKKEGNAGGATHAPYEVWIHASPVAEIPSMVTDQALINKGWREVVARKGDDETRRTREEFVK